MNADVQRTRVFYGQGDSDTFRTYEDRDVRILANGATDPRAEPVMAYFRRVVEGLRADDPIRDPFDALSFIHPESVLATVLRRAPVEPTGRVRGGVPLLFPFSSNISQREAVTRALTYPISVIEGPPGTGKTQTILNLLATLTTETGTSVGVVSFNNAAVDNVREKLEEEGVGYVVASLGKAANRNSFYVGQRERNAAVDQSLACPLTDVAPSVDAVVRLADRLDRLQRDERRHAQSTRSLELHRLQRQHVLKALAADDGELLPDLPLARRSSERILDFLVETQVEAEPTGWIAKWFADVRRYARYGSLRGVDLESSTTALRAQVAYYDRRIAELADEVARLERSLDQAGLAGLVEEHRHASRRILDAGLRRRYERLRRVEYDKSYTRRFRSFTEDYPVILSTCHSLRRSIGAGELLDYLVIDEASQVDLLSAFVALACCRNVVIVGDLRQLGHIPDEHAGAKAGAPPAPGYDYVKQSLLSSIVELYGDAVPRTMLREHYRCDPQIIGFCNEKFYEGQLVPLAAHSSTRPLMLFRTVEGNHMRSHRDGGGRSNQREIDVIADEIIPQHFADTSPSDIGVTSPYRLQASRAHDALDGVFESDTVHRFQGRQKRVVIMTTVLDETWRGRSGTRFVDDPRLVNVAVSRAVDCFVLVTNHAMLPTSRHLRDLMGYVAYRDPESDVEDSQVTSVFDLLYERYSERLASLAGRLRGELQYRSEDIIWTVLHDLLAEPGYEGLHAIPQVLVRNLFHDLTGLTADQRSYIGHRASVDFVVYNKVTKRPLMAIEVDGFEFHENNPDQLVRDERKDAIFSHFALPLLRLRTTGASEAARIRTVLDGLMANA